MQFTDETREQARELIARYPKPRSALLPLLHLVQSVEGYVSPAGIGLCAELLDLTKAEVGAVATFYTMYKRRPVGNYHVGVCTNTLCAVMGGDLLHDVPAAPGRHVPRRRVHQHAVRGARRRRDPRGAAGAHRAVAERD
ncbi:MAG: NADH-quinone oxidoreductase subunit, partial [Frankiaceae bacterium]|nr:NADH-quinone oxidoreductase subunit [Frankiaceae bacterium]